MVSAHLLQNMEVYYGSSSLQTANVFLKLGSSLLTDIYLTFPPRALPFQLAIRQRAHKIGQLSRHHY